MLERIRHLLEMIRFSHTLFALPFAMLAAVMAWTAAPGDTFRWRHLAGVLLCMVFARSVAMAFNRLVDRKIDAENPRTKSRHLPAGLLSVPAVTAFCVVMALGFFASTLLFLPNPLPPLLALPVLAWLCGYSFARRFTSLARVWMGAGWMLAPGCAWIGIRGEFVLADVRDLLPAAVLGCGVLLWVTGFDIIYACQDYRFDYGAKLHSIPVALGVPGALRLAAACHGAMVLVLAALPLTPLAGGPALSLGAIYWVALGLVALLLAVEHWLVRPDDLTRVNLAFFHINSIVSIGLFVLGSIDLLL